MRWLEAVVEAADPESQLLPSVGLQLPGGVRLELNQAIDYTLARGAALIRYVDDGRLEIDNNIWIHDGS